MRFVINMSCLLILSLLPCYGESITIIDINPFISQNKIETACHHAGAESLTVSQTIENGSLAQLAQEPGEAEGKIYCRRTNTKDSIACKCEYKCNDQGQPILEDSNCKRHCKKQLCKCEHKCQT